MKSIQFLLLILTLMSGILGSAVFRSKSVCRLVAGFLFCLSVVLVILPDLTTCLARTLGVGRGTDLLLYIVFFAGVHAFLLMYMQTRRLERKFIASIRVLAIQQATKLD
jgi:small membrane protein